MYTEESFIDLEKVESYNSYLHPESDKQQVPFPVLELGDDQYSLFFGSSMKPGDDKDTFSPEDMDGMPAGKSPVDDLLDLDNYEHSWRNEVETNSSYAFQQTAECNISVMETPLKRKSISDKEIAVEIDETSKRAKRCTAILSEEEKQLRRKELNRLAAQRCRNKKKGTADYLEKEIELLQEKNEELKKKLEKLTSTKEELYEIIKFHFSNCPTKPAQFT